MLLPLQPVECADEHVHVQTMLTTGSKGFGPKLKVYDFALYTNPSQLQQACPLAARLPPPPASAATATADASDSAWASPPAGAILGESNDAGGVSDDEVDADAPGRSTRSERRRARRAERTARRERRARASADGICKEVRGNTAVEMSLTVRPARDIPLALLRSEYRRILKNRMQAVGGSPDDPSLQELLRFFDAAALPAAATRGRCIRKGTPVHFSRSSTGALTAVAAGETLTTVSSAKLCEAVFDLYLGEAPVSKKARDNASTALHAMLSDASQPLSITV